MSCAESTQAVGAPRPRMARHLLSVLVTFLLFVCCACGLAYAGDTAQQRRIALFASGRTGGPEKNVRRFGPSFLLAADGVMVALAEAENLVGKRRGGGDTLARYINERGEDADAVARYIKQRRGAADIVARYIETEGRDWAEKTIEGGGVNWKTQLPAPTRDEAGHSCFPWNPMAVAKGNKIYLLVVRHVRGDQDSQTESGCEFALVVGDVKPTSGGHGTDRAIEWQTPELPLPGLSKQFGDLLLKPLPFAGGSAFLTRGGEIVFVVGVRKENKYGSAILYAKDTDVTKWRVSFTPFFADCYYPSVFAWEEKLIALPTHCSGGGQKVQESADMGATWTEAVGPFSRLWDSLQENDGFTTATIDNKTVLLSTHLREKKGNTRREYEICLRLADGNRVHDIGPIVTDANFVASSGLVYANGELFLLHQGGTMAPRSIFLTRLDDELESIRSVLRTWAENDARLSKPRHAVTTPQGASPGSTLCLASVCTDGLVGLLSDNGSATCWEDEYHYVNATVRNGTRVGNGFRFTVGGAGARWPVGQEHLGVRYNFSRYGFTVAATVTIHEVPVGDRPLLTVGGAGGRKRLGLWYDRNGQWKVMSEGDREATQAGDWAKDRPYKVAFMLRNGRFFAHVDGKPLGGLSYVPAPGEELSSIEDVLIGGYGDGSAKDTVSHVTVTNVLLYNRPLNDTELEK